MTFEPQAMADWLKVIQREKSRSTCQGYETAAKEYLRWLGLRNLTLVAVSTDALQEYVGEMRSEFASATVAVRVVAIRSLYAFLFSADAIPINPAKHLEAGVRTTRATTRLTVDEMGVMLDTAHRLALETDATPFLLASLARRAAFCELLYACGVSVSEAAALTPESVRSPSNLVTIPSNRQAGERVVPVNERTIEALQLWRSRAARIGTASSNWLFHAARNGSQPLTRAGALLDVKEAAEAAGLSRWRLVSPRAVRFAFASHMIGNGFDKKLLAYMLGFKDLGSLDLYLSGTAPEQAI